MRVAAHVGIPLVDRPKRQTSTASPAKPGGLSLTLGGALACFLRRGATLVDHASGRFPNAVALLGILECGAIMTPMERQRRLWSNVPVRDCGEQSAIASSKLA